MESIRRLKKSKYLSAKVIVVCVFCLSSFSSYAEWYGDTESIMGTVISVSLWSEDEALAEKAIAAVMAEMHRVDATLSPYKEHSELSQVNSKAAEAPQKISLELTQIINKALYFSRVSKGAFDISFASVGQHYDYRSGQQPDTEQKQNLLPAINYRLIELDEKNQTVEFKHPNLKIDLGGIAKGYAVDRSVEILRGLGVESATVSAGGDSRVLGDKRGEPWLIGIKNPRGFESEDLSTEGQLIEGKQRVAITLPLIDTAVSTSGDYERFFIDDDGERIHHILNPRTGDSATGIASVTILGPEGFDTDPMSTTVFVMGVESGLAFIDSFSQFDCIIIDTHGQVHYSQGLTAPN